MSLALQPPVMAMRDRSAFLGIGLTLASTVIFAGCNAAAKWIMADIPAGEMLFIRSVVALALISLFIPRAEVTAVWTGGQLRLHGLRVACSALEVMCFYWSVTFTPLADMTTIYLASPIYVTAMAAIFLSERVGWRRWAAVCVGFGGVIVAVHPTPEHEFHRAALVAVVGSILYAISLVVTRRLRATPSTVLVAAQMAALLVVSVTTAAFGWVMPSLAQMGIMVVIGVVSTFAFWCVNRGLQLAAASAVAPFNYMSIVWAVILGFIVFGDVPAVSMVAGAAIIIAAGLFIVLRESRLKS